MKTIILFVVFVNFCDGVVTPKDKDITDVPVSFKKLGYLATGNHYGHLYTEIDMNGVELAIRNATNFLEGLREQRTSPQVKRKFQFLSKLLEETRKIVDKIQAAFFVKENMQSQKRDLGLGLGLVNLGLSVYNTYKIWEIEKSVSGMSRELELVSESVIEQDHSLTMMEGKLNNITEICARALTEIVTYENVENMVRNFHSHILMWAGGLEALLYGQLHPSLIQPKTLEVSLDKLREKAARRGLIPLATDLTAVFKQEVSFMVKRTGTVKVFIHIPLMDREPLELFEHLEIPIRISEKLSWFVTADENNVLAIDKASTVGLQMRKMELLHCNVKVTPIGKVYFCPNTGLVKNHIADTCLGSLMLKPQDAEKKCQLFVAEVNEFSIQTGPRTIVAYIKEKDFLYQICDDGKRVQRKERGLARIHVEPRCTLISTEFIFKPEEDITVESDFIETVMPMDTESFEELKDYEEELQNAFKGLDAIYPTKRRSVHQLKVYLSQKDLRKQEKLVDTVLISCAAGMALMSVVIISVLYCKYKKEKKEERNIQDERH